MIWRFYTLARNGVMGINERNVRLVNELNPRRLMRLVNDKIVTKTLAGEAGIAVPELYGTIANPFDMRRLKGLIERPEGCVIKPANGSQGNGILVLMGPMQGGGYRLGNGRRISFDDVRFHVNNILSGMYSLSGQPDRAMVEYRVTFDDVFDAISFRGVPDIRIIVLRGLPIAGMLRLPTAESDGKANLHKGGVGVGLDLISGVTRRGMQNGRVVDQHPDTAHDLTGFQVPHWDHMLDMAARAFEVTGLGYLGADIVLDKARGPLLLELNARPGISIQVANRQGLRPAVKAALAADVTGLDAGARVALARKLYREAMASRPGASTAEAPQSAPVT